MKGERDEEVQKENWNQEEVSVCILRKDVATNAR
jgi:hypothetical protein